jgi:ParB family transcriptional regulator, chromosome partitioning protein
MTKAKTKTKLQNGPAPDAASPSIRIHEIRQIPLHQLFVDDANVRTIKNGVTIDMLADDIAFRGLLQSLAVRQLKDQDGLLIRRFGVIAGGRRLKALQKLASEKRIDGSQTIPCILRDGENATDDSLAENVFREQLHPLDQFQAFKQLADQGVSDAEIAKRYHVTEKFVRQRLKLASASPVLLQAFKDDDFSLEKLEAFCVTDDHTRQEALWQRIQDGHGMGAYAIRQALTETSVEADDPRARYVGLDAYQAAGGTIMNDLFRDDSGPWLEDPTLLESLADAKITAEKERVLALGFKWADVTLNPREVKGLKRNLSQLPNLASGLSKDERAEERALSAEFDALLEKGDTADDDDPFTAEDQARLDEIRPVLIEFRNRPPKLSAKQTARTGVLISLDEEGDLCIEYGYLRPEDVKEAKKSADASGDTANTGDTDPEHSVGDALNDDDNEDYVRAGNNPGAVIAGKAISDSLARDLTSYRTIALQNSVAQDFDAAFLGCLHALCSSLFRSGSYNSCVKIAPRELFLRGVVGLEKWTTYKEVQDRHQAWGDRLPGQGGAALWNALCALSNDERADLFAHCVSLTVDAVYGNQGRASSAAHADLMAEAVSLDMKAAGWESTTETYFDRVNKEQIIEAVREAAPTKVALIDHLKKPVMAKEAERLIKDTDWLPPLLRSPYAQATPPVETSVNTVEEPAAPLPAFLQGGLNGSAAHAA